MTPDPITRLLQAPWFSRTACALLTLPYWTSAVSKLFDLPGASAEAQHFALQPAWLIVALTIVVQLGGSLLVIFTRAARLGAGALGVFTAIATIIAHPFWQVADFTQRFHERNTFLEHVGLIGGLALAAIISERRDG